MVFVDFFFLHWDSFSKIKFSALIGDLEWDKLWNSDALAYVFLIENLASRVCTFFFDFLNNFINLLMKYKKFSALKMKYRC